VGVRGLQQPAPRVQVNLRNWGREGHKREINQAVALAVGRKCRWNRHSQSWSCTPNCRLCQYRQDGVLVLFY